MPGIHSNKWCKKRTIDGGGGRREREWDACAAHN